MSAHVNGFKKGDTFNQKPLSWVYEGGCMRCTSHVAGSHGYVSLARNGIRRTIPQLIIRRRSQHKPGIDAMHSCDNRWCINPAHISAGTRSDNVNDAVKKGRWRGWTKESILQT